MYASQPNVHDFAKNKLEPWLKSKGRRWIQTKLCYIKEGKARFLKESGDALNNNRRGLNRDRQPRQIPEW